MDGIPISAVLPGLAAAATDDAAMAGGLPGAQFIGSMLSSVGIDPSLIGEFFQKIQTSTPHSPIYTINR